MFGHYVPIVVDVVGRAAGFVFLATIARLHPNRPATLVVVDVIETQAAVFGVDTDEIVVGVPGVAVFRILKQIPVEIVGDRNRRRSRRWTTCLPSTLVVKLTLIGADWR
jgi:hypothetical protein